MNSNDFPFKSLGLHFLDSGASSQKPSSVIEAMSNQYSSQYANIHRGVYSLSEQCTQAYEDARAATAEFFGAPEDSVVVFTSGNTAASNLLAYSWGLDNLKPDDEVLMPISEHHGQIVPWQLIANRTGAKVKFVPLNDDLTVTCDEVFAHVSGKTKVIAMAQVSNVTGAIYPVAEICKKAKTLNILTIIDGAQSAPHFDIDLKAMGADFFIASPHKMLGPTGLGICIGKKKILDQMSPFMGGGDMIRKVTVDGSTFTDAPERFEAGTPPIVEVIGFHAALKYLKNMDRTEYFRKDQELGKMALEFLKSKPQVRIFTPTDLEKWVGIVTFAHDSIHPHDIAAFQDAHKVSVRAGHHCAQPLMNFLKVDSTVRISPYIYNTKEDILAFQQGFEATEKLFL